MNKLLSTPLELIRLPFFIAGCVREFLVRGAILVETPGTCEAIDGESCPVLFRTVIQVDGNLINTIPEPWRFKDEAFAEQAVQHQKNVRELLHKLNAVQLLGARAMSLFGALLGCFSVWMSDMPAALPMGLDPILAKLGWFAFGLSGGAVGIGLLILRPVIFFVIRRRMTR